MAVELAAVRILAPYFGDSAYVWTNVIGVILLALAAGAYLGGRLAEAPGGSPLRAILGSAAIALAIVPLVAPPLGEWLLPQDLPLDAAMAAMVSGSFAATALLFALPIALLGAVSPGLVAGTARRGLAVGRAAGAIGAVGTIGSLIGTFATTHWLVPTFGCRATLWLAAVLLVLAAACCRPSRRLGALGLVVLASGLLPFGELRAPLPGQRLLAACETPYQYLRVVATEPRDGQPERIELKINEGLDSYHSVAVTGQVLTSTASSAAPSSYYDFHALVPWLVGDGMLPQDFTALSIGDAAGTFRRIYGGLFPTAVVDAIEIDAKAVELGDRHFPGVRAPGTVRTAVDGRAYVAVATKQWHAIHLDAYAHQIDIPAQLASREFFVLAHARLHRGGVLACNVGGLSAEDPVVAAIGGTMATVFRDVRAVHIPNARNVLLVGRRDLELEPASLSRVAADTTDWSGADREIWSKVLASAQREHWATIAPTATPLVDDCPRLDRLLLQSYVGVADAGLAMTIAGTDAPEGAEAAAWSAYSAGDTTATLAAIARSRKPTPYLRSLAGSARWLRRELRSAAAEFDAGLALAPEPALAESLRGNRSALDAELVPVDHAEATAHRNRWLSWFISLVLLTIAASAYRMSRTPLLPSVSVSTAAR